MAGSGLALAASVLGRAGAISVDFPASTTGIPITAVVLARLGEAEPAVVLSGAFSAHFLPDISGVDQDVTMGIEEAQSLARHALGEAAYSAALGRGAAMDDNQVVEYMQGEFRRLAALRAEPRAQAPESPPGPARPSRRE